MFDVHIKTVDDDVVLHNIRFARFDEANRYFAFIGRTTEETIILAQEQIISLEFGKELSDDT